ncbi:MAG: hypothetical protein ACRCYW_17445 [Aeromonas sp.]|uniref:hypothetical protein n=1 Tax=Aeromonas sp. TaxID=647 RepID=UPI003F2E0CAB
MAEKWCEGSLNPFLAPGGEMTFLRVIPGSPAGFFMAEKWREGSLNSFLAPGSEMTYSRGIPGLQAGFL